MKRPPRSDGDSTGEIRRLRARAPASFAIGQSGDWIAAEALLADSDAGFGVVAGLLPEPALRLARAAQAGDAAEARRIDAALAPLWALFMEKGSVRVMRALAEALGLGRWEPPRPLLPAGPDVRVRLDEALDRIAMLSSPSSAKGAT